MNPRFQIGITAYSTLRTSSQTSSHTFLIDFPEIYFALLENIVCFLPSVFLTVFEHKVTIEDLKDCLPVTTSSIIKWLVCHGLEFDTFKTEEFHPYLSFN